MHIPDWAVLGAEVVCIKAFTHNGRVDAYAIALPEVNANYTIRSIFDNGTYVGLRFIEIYNPVFPYDEGVGEVSFLITHFKPVLRMKREVEQEIFQKRPTTVEPA